MRRPRGSTRTTSRPRTACARDAAAEPVPASDAPRCACESHRHRSAAVAWNTIPSEHSLCNVHSNDGTSFHDQEICRRCCSRSPRLLAAPASAGRRQARHCSTATSTAAPASSSPRTRASTCTFKPSRGGGRRSIIPASSPSSASISARPISGTLALGRAGAEPTTMTTAQLAGNYFGVNAEASVVTGGGANLLVGGFAQHLHAAAAERPGTDRPEPRRRSNLDRADFLAQVSDTAGGPLERRLPPHAQHTAGE